MSEAIEKALKHWGEYVREGAPSGGLGSPAGTLVEWKGCPPRTGSSGSQMLLAGAGPDVLVSEVDAALSAIEHQEGGAELVTLAKLRYLYDPALSKAVQVRDLALGPGEAGLKAYTRMVKRLHQRLEVELKARAEKLDNQLRESRRAGDRMRKASLQQATAAHRARGREFEAAQGGQGAIAAHKARKAAAKVVEADRSSGDSAPKGAGKAPKGAGWNNP